jgi:hypothetical protein
MDQIVTGYKNTGRSTRFTPANIRQIINLVERGRSREEIAEVIGVTVGTLQVTCSKMGISLRRPRADVGAARKESSSALHPIALKKIDAQPESSAKAAVESPANHQTDANAPAVVSNEPSTCVKFAIEIRYKGQMRRTELPLSQEMVGKLALEAELRDLRLGELLAQVISSLEKDKLLELALEELRTSRDH